MINWIQLSVVISEMVPGRAYLVDACLLESILQLLEIVDVLMLETRGHLDLLQHDRTWKKHIHELAVCGTYKIGCKSLLNSISITQVIDDMIIWHAR